MKAGFHFSYWFEWFSAHPSTHTVCKPGGCYNIIVAFGLLFKQSGCSVLDPSTRMASCRMSGVRPSVHLRLIMYRPFRAHSILYVLIVDVLASVEQDQVWIPTQVCRMFHPAQA